MKEVEYPLNYKWCWHCNANTLFCPKCGTNECSMGCSRLMLDPCPMQGWWDWAHEGHLSGLVPDFPTREEIADRIKYFEAEFELKDIDSVRPIDWVKYQDLSYWADRYDIQLKPLEEYVQLWIDKCPHLKDDSRFMERTTGESWGKTEEDRQKYLDAMFEGFDRSKLT